MDRPKGVGGGQARVYIDGALKTTVDLNVSTTGSTQRQTAYQQSWPNSGKHTIKVVVVGPPGNPRVDIDGFAVSTL